jgi:hypothetical protein
MDFKVVSAVLAVLCLVLGALALSGGGVRTVYVNSSAEAPEDLAVSYLYPLRCVNCDLNKPGECDYCNSYYDERVMDTLGEAVGVPIRFFVSDSVSRPGVLVAYKGKMTLGDGRTKYNLAHTLCQFAGVKVSCDLFQGESVKVKACMDKYGVPSGSVLYQTGGKDCPACQKTTGVVEELRASSYNESSSYVVRTVDRSDASQKRLVSECMQSFDSAEYVPQLLCPASGSDLTGQFTLSQAQQFADRCVESAK